MGLLSLRCEVHRQRNPPSPDILFEIRAWICTTHGLHSYRRPPAIAPTTIKPYDLSVYLFRHRIFYLNNKADRFKIRLFQAWTP